VSRRAHREPLAYIVGHREFWGLPFEVSPSVLIPRPETELIVEAALELVSATAPSPAICDVGTGSGCVAIALATERPLAAITATDISEAALSVARRNAKRNGTEHIRFVTADLLNGVDGPFDLITANPPYVRQVDQPGLQPEVRDHEPAVALFGGPDGTSLVRRFVAEATPKVRPGGHLIFEFGLGQDDTIEQLVADHPDLELVELRRDIQGIARTAVARRR